MLRLIFDNGGKILFLYYYNTNFLGGNFDTSPSVKISTAWLGSRNAKYENEIQIKTLL